MVVVSEYPLILERSKSAKAHLAEMKDLSYSVGDMKDIEAIVKLFASWKVNIFVRSFFLGPLEVSFFGSSRNFQNRLQKIK